MQIEMLVPYNGPAADGSGTVFVPRGAVGQIERVWFSSAWDDTKQQSVVETHIVVNVPGYLLRQSPVIDTRPCSISVGQDDIEAVG